MTKNIQAPVVWLVDDDEAVRDSLGVLLECEGFRVHLFESGQALLRVLPDLPRGCLLLDMHMAGMDGFAVMAALRERGIQIPTIIFTARGDRMLEAQVLRAGAVGLLDKPVSEEKLFAALQAALGNTAPEQG